MWLGILIGVGFFLAGRRIARGSAQDTLATSVLSILVGLLYLGIGVAALFMLQNTPLQVTVAGVIAVVIGFGLFLPAGFGLSGRSEYVAWKAATQPPTRWRRRRVEPNDARNGPQEQGRQGDQGTSE